MLRVGQQLVIPGGQELADASGPSAEPATETAAEPATGHDQGRTTSSRGGHREVKSFIATVTAYSIRGPTATDTYTRWGVVAVDPRVIPLGSKLLIEGFEDVFVAEDMGGGVRGNWVDIWFPNHADAVRFGLQSRRVTIIEP